MTVSMDVILLAGDRGPGDPLAQVAGVSGKTLVPVLGQAMLTRVLSALNQWQRLGRVLLVAPSAPGYAEAVEAGGLPPARLVHVQPQASPSASVASALAAAGPDRPLLMTTADHVLLRPAWLDQLLEPMTDVDLLVGLADYDRVMQRFPGSRRTRYRFSDRSVCGTNLFVFRTGAADAVLARWQVVEQQRKQPWRIVSMLGWMTLGRYLAGRLPLEEGFSALSRALGIRVAAQMLEDPLSAVDVDTPADLALVESVLHAEQHAC